MIKRVSRTFVPHSKLGVGAIVEEHAIHVLDGSEGLGAVFEHAV